MFSLYPTCVVVDILLLVLLGNHIKGFIEYHNYMYSTRRHVDRLMQYGTKPSAVLASRHLRVLIFFSYTQARQCFKCYIVLPGRLARSIFLYYSNYYNFR